MKTPARAAAAALVLVLLYGGFCLACPQWTRALGLDVWNYQELADEARREGRLRNELSATDERIKHRLDLKAVVTDEVIEGRASLADATERFMALNRADPDIVSHTRQMFPAPTEAEATARQVINFVHARLRHEPSRRDEVLCRLRAELSSLAGAGVLTTY